MKKLDPRALGLTLAVIGGLSMLLLGLAGYLIGYGNQAIYIMSEWYIGFEPTMMGAVLGGVWGFVDGLIFGLLIGWVYNKFLIK